MISRSDKPCRFCAIVSGAAEAYRVFEDQATLAFLDIHPLAIGHVLLVPKLHVATLWEADAGTVAHLALAGQALTAAVRGATGCEGIFLAQNNVVSQSVPHLHTHIVPRNRDDRLFSAGLVWKRVRYGSTAQMAEVAAAIARVAAGAPKAP